MNELQRKDGEKINAPKIEAQEQKEMIKNGKATINDIRIKNGLCPIEDGDKLFTTEVKPYLHKLQLKNEPGHLEIKLDDFRVKGITDYAIKNISSAHGRAELTLKIIVRASDIGL